MPTLPPENIKKPKVEPKVEDYRLPEIESETPSFLFAPTINNDGRRLFAGSRSYAVLTKPSKGTKGAILESIDMQ